MVGSFQVFGPNMFLETDRSMFQLYPENSRIFADNCTKNISEINHAEIKISITFVFPFPDAGNRVKYIIITCLKKSLQKGLTAFIDHEQSVGAAIDG